MQWPMTITIENECSRAGLYCYKFLYIHIYKLLKNRSTYNLQVNLTTEVTFIHIKINGGTFLSVNGSKIDDLHLYCWFFHKFL